jgi:hypothetical protein
MKRLLIVLVVLMVVAAGAFAQTFTFSQFQSAFQSFANGVAGALPLEASVGLNWSDAYIGQLLDTPPHFGIGVTGGAATIPYAAIKSAITTFGANIPSNLSFLSSVGIPLPSYSVDVRIGGFILPFDVGLKFGYLPSGALSNFGINSFTADYLMVGGDVRYAILRDSGASPGLSVGVGYTYMKGNIGVPGILNGPITIQSVTVGSNTYNIGFTNPSLNFFWNTSVIDAKVQLSKTLFIITPYIGLGASYGISNAGGGMQSAMTINGVAATQAQIDQINSAFGTNFTLQNPGFGVYAGGSGFSARVFGGFSFNIFILKIGVGAEYEFLSGSLAAMANARIQL